MSTRLRDFGELSRAMLGLVLGVLFGLCGLLLADQPLHEVGVSMLSSPEVLAPVLLLGVPVGMGFWPGVVSAYGRDRGLLTACLAALGTLPVLVAVRWSEAVHLAFAAPFLAVLTLWGALLGWWVVARANRSEPELQAGADADATPEAEATPESEATPETETISATEVAAANHPEPEEAAVEAR